jgi:kumamolisin
MSVTMFIRRLSPILFFVAALGLATNPGIAAISGGHVRLSESFRDPMDSAVHRVRDVLTPAEETETMNIVVSLRMRNLSELEARLHAGRIISPDEMEAKYLPLKSDYERVATWLNDQGFVTTLVDRNHTNIFVRGSVATIAAALEVDFARVVSADGESTAAVNAPSLPAAFAAVILGVDGLQPYLHLRPAPTVNELIAVLPLHPTRVIPADVLAAYHAPDGLDGTGQVIAIVAGDIPLASDLTTFYQLSMLTKMPSALTVVRVNGGPTVTGLSNEVSMDVEWSSALAPGAKVMLYATPTYSISDLIAACVQIMNDGKAKIVSHSASTLETNLATSTLLSNSQVFAQMAAAGITVLHGDGDNGSTGIPVYPASDPFVTGLSGTTLTFDSNWNATDETAWNQAGGGVSTVFARPDWQKGPGVPAGTMRCVPDAGSLSSTNTTTGTEFPLCVVNGQTKGVGGSSLTGPVWSGLVALINQARAKVGLPTIGLLGPRIYPLLGSAAFKDLVRGSNGAYSARPGYDLCTGVGTPNVTELIAAFTAADPPAFSSGPTSQTVSAGSTVVLSVETTGTPAPSFQWSRDGQPIVGATGRMLVLRGTDTQAGSYSCVASNSQGTSTSKTALLNVASTPNLGRLINLSVMTDISASAPKFTVGTVISGAANVTKAILVRADGPSLTSFGVVNVLANPRIDLFSGSSLLASNDDWGGSADSSTAIQKTGAFAYTDKASKDSALTLSALLPGNYSVDVTGVGGSTGTAMAELYDANVGTDVTADTPRLINLSVSKLIPTSGTLTAGFVIGGPTSKTLLIRAIGPGLTPFNVSGVMPNPQLVLYNGQSTIVAMNDDWGGDAQISATADRVGAFSVADRASKDAMLLITLPPGSYSVQVSDVNGAAGTAIVEVYEVP